MTTLAGTSLGRYEIRSQVGAGGMGEVYLAEDTQLERAVALKILPLTVADDEQRMRRFVQEAKAASALNHPNIITIYEVGKIDSVHFITTEFIDGMTLRQLITAARTSLRETFDIMVQVASALSAAHEAGIVHRDIKPENIMLRRDGYVKVVDFGLAKLIEKGHPAQTSDPEAPTKPAVNTEAGVVMGTVNYMSPEQARGLAIDSRSDIWSFGIVLYEMLTGYMPFDGQTASDVMAAILEREAPTLTSHLPNAPTELERIVTKSLSKDREERYQTIKDLMIDIRRLKQHLEIEAALGSDTRKKRDTKKITGARTVSSAEYLVGEIRSHKRVAIMALAILSVVVVVSVYLLYSRSSPIDSIAVVPFSSAESDPLIEELTDGITDNIINELPQLGNLRVVPRTTMFTFKGQSADPQKVGKDLNVRAVLTGRLLKRGNTVIVRTELTDINKQSQIWGDAFTTTLPEIIGGATPLSLQEEMSKQIFEKLRSQLRGNKAAGQSSR